MPHLCSKNKVNVTLFLDVFIFKLTNIISDIADDYFFKFNIYAKKDNM